MIRWFLLAYVALWLVACGEGDRTAPRTSTPAEAGLEKVSLVLNWFPEAEHGGFYAALVHGFYREAGIEMEIRPGGVDIPVIQMVDMGRVDFGVANADPILIGRGQGADVVAVMAPIQVSPRCLVVRADSRVQTFDDLHDLTLAMSPRAPFAHFLRRTLPLRNVSIVGYPGNVAPFLAGQVDAMQGYVFSEPYVAEQQGVPTRVLMVSDLGFDPYASCLLVRRATLEQRPDLVRRVVQASVRGWLHYFEHPEETNRHINSLNPEMDLGILAYGVEVLRPLCFTDDVPAADFGRMTAERWDTLRVQLEELDIVRAGAVRTAELFTNDFLR